MPPSTPDTALTRAAHTLLTSCSPLPLVNHCHRTYLFGALLLEGQSRAYDAEALYVASLLHDLGLAESYEDGVTSFELRGADLARDSLTSWGAPDQLADLVHAAISLHLEVSAATDPRPEVAGVTLGAAVDVLGLRLDELTPALVEETLTRFPRHGAKDFLVSALRRQIALKPGSRIAHHQAKYQFTDLVSASPFTE